MTITRGMPEGAIRNAVPDAHTIWCDKNADDNEYYDISPMEERGSSGGIIFQDGRVLTTQRSVALPNRAFDGLLSRYKLLAELTE